MKPGTIPRVALAKHPHEMPPSRIDHWLLAGTHVLQPYPCTCWYDPCRYERCPDRYRTEGDALPWGCCGRAGHTREADAGRVADKSRKTPGFAAQPDRRTSWEARFPTTPGARVADQDLWGGVPDEAPPDWDGIDDGPPVHGETLEDPEGHSDRDEEFQPLGDVPEEPWGIRARRRRVAEAQCDCPTPWDAAAPSLLLVDDPKAPVASSATALSEKPGADVREEADTALELAGQRRAKPWKAGRHALLPGDGGTKTRECWRAPLASGGVAVIDLPTPPRNSGIHCADCCRNFSNAGAWELHRKRDRQGRSTCVDPTCVLLVEPARLAVNASLAAGGGTPLLKRSIGGVWTLDPLAVWGGRERPTPEQAQQIWLTAQQRLSGQRWRYGRGHNRVPR